MSQLRLQQRIEFQGVFWPPDHPERKFSGTLSRRRHRLELATSISLDELSAFVELHSIPERIDVLHGFTPLGRCTLLGLFSPRAESSINFAEEYSLSSRTYRVTHCVVGAHLPGVSAPSLKSASMQYSGLAHWIALHPGVRLDGKKLVFDLLKDHAQLLDVRLDGLSASICLDASTGFEHEPSYGTRLRRKLALTITSELERPLDWFLTLARRLERFWSVILGATVTLRVCSLAVADSTAWLLSGPQRRAETPNPSVWVNPGPRELGAAMQKWIAKSGSLEPIESLVYRTIPDSSLFVETEFLVLAQALEGFHRVSAGGKRSFGQRICELLSSLEASRRARLLGEGTEFRRQLVATRDHLTHLGTPVRSDAVTSGRDLFLFNQKLQALLRLLLLKFLGFSEEAVFDAVWNQSQRWS